MIGARGIEQWTAGTPQRRTRKGLQVRVRNSTARNTAVDFSTMEVFNMSNHSKVQHGVATWASQVKTALKLCDGTKQSDCKACDYPDCNCYVPWEWHFRRVRCQKRINGLVKECRRSDQYVKGTYCGEVLKEEELSMRRKQVEHYFLNFLGMDGNERRCSHELTDACKEDQLKRFQEKEKQLQVQTCQGPAPATKREECQGRFWPSALIASKLHVGLVPSPGASLAFPYRVVDDQDLRFFQGLALAKEACEGSPSRAFKQRAPFWVGNVHTSHKYAKHRDSQICQYKLKQGQTLNLIDINDPGAMAFIFTDPYLGAIFEPPDHDKLSVCDQCVRQVSGPHHKNTDWGAAHQTCSGDKKCGTGPGEMLEFAYRNNARASLGPIDLALMKLFCARLQFKLEPSSILFHGYYALPAPTKSGWLLPNEIMVCNPADVLDFVGSFRKDDIAIDSMMEDDDQVGCQEISGC